MSEQNKPETPQSGTLHYVTNLNTEPETPHQPPKFCVYCGTSNHLDSEHKRIPGPPAVPIYCEYCGEQTRRSLGGVEAGGLHKPGCLLMTETPRPEMGKVYVLESRSDKHDWHPCYELAVGFSRKIISFGTMEEADNSLKHNSDFSGPGGNILRRTKQEYRIVEYLAAASPEMGKAKRFLDEGPWINKVLNAVRVDDPDDIAITALEAVLVDMLVAASGTESAPQSFNDGLETAALLIERVCEGCDCEHSRKYAELIRKRKPQPSFLTHSSAPKLSIKDDFLIDLAIWEAIDPNFEDGGRMMPITSAQTKRLREVLRKLASPAASSLTQAGPEKDYQLRLGDAAMLLRMSVGKLRKGDASQNSLADKIASWLQRYGLIGNILRDGAAQSQKGGGE